MKMPKLLKKHRMQAATRRVNPRAEEEYDGEPNIRLSSAIAVVLVLHVVAVVGIYAFNGLKKHKLPAQPSALEQKIEKPAPAAASEIAPAAEPKVITSLPIKPTVQEAPRIEPKAVAKQSLPPAEPKLQTPKDSGQTYTVVKGDNPLTIAKKFSVGYDELLKLNKIEDPRKLQIGQKLHLPLKNK